MDNDFIFKCTRCGHCCRNEGVVLFSDNEIINISEFLGINPRMFKEQFLTFSSSGYTHHVSHGKQCVFLENNLCSINSVKPKQCKSFPYWKEYIDTDGKLKNFNRTCMGIMKKPG
jgi:uncharacterized protein